MVQSEGELDYDDDDDDDRKPRWHHRWATRKQSWDSLGRVSCDRRDPVKTIEIDTFQPYNTAIHNIISNLAGPPIHRAYSNPSPSKKEAFFKSIPHAHVATGKTTAREQGRSVAELWRLPPQCPTTWSTASTRARLQSQREKSGSGSAKKRLSFPVLEPGLGDSEYSWRSSSYKSIAHGIHPGMEQRSNISSCCNESIEGDEIYPPSTNDLRRWLR